MRKNFNKKTWFCPMPIMIISSYSSDNTANAMTAAWGGIFDTEKVFVCIAKDHKSNGNIRERGGFVISFSSRENIDAVNFLGKVSQRDVKDKVVLAALKTEKSSFVDAPIILNFPIALECEVERIIGEENFIAKIVNISVDESVLAEDGIPDIDKISPLLYDPLHEEYRSFDGRRVLPSDICHL